MAKTNISPVSRDEPVDAPHRADHVPGRAFAVVQSMVEPTHRPGESTAELGRALLALAHEQTRHQLEVLRALTDAVEWDRATRAVDWERVVQIQSDVLRRNRQRAAQLNQRYLDVTQAVMTAAAAAAERRAGEAA